MDKQEAFNVLIKQYPDKKGILVRLFPNLYDEDSVFCIPGQILRRKNRDSRYIVLLDRLHRCYVIANLSSGYLFNNRLPVNSTHPAPLTNKQFRELLKDGLNDFYVEEN